MGFPPQHRPPCVGKLSVQVLKLNVPPADARAPQHKALAFFSRAGVECLTRQHLTLFSVFKHSRDLLAQERQRTAQVVRVRGLCIAISLRVTGQQHRHNLTVAVAAWKRNSTCQLARRADGRQLGIRQFPCRLLPLASGFCQQSGAQLRQPFGGISLTHSRKDK